MTVTNYSFDGFPDNTDIGDVPGWSRVSGNAGSLITNSDGRLDIVTVSPESLYVSDSGATDHQFTVTYHLQAGGTNAYPCCARVVDINNMYCVRLVTGNTIELARRVGGVLANLGTIAAGARANGDVLGIRAVGSTIQALWNGNVVIEVTDTTFTTGTLVGFLVRGSAAADRYTAASVESIVTAGPSINPTGTDTTLTVGETHNIAFANLTSNPVSAALVYDNGVSVALPDFALGTVTDGAATATVTAAIGNLPYTDTAYPAANYQYVVTCADDSELTLSGVTIQPATGRDFVTAVDPVQDSTSIIVLWTEGNAVTGDQVGAPELLDPVYEEEVLVDGIYLTINPDLTFSGESVSGTFPTQTSIQIDYWDSVGQTRYYITVPVAWSADGGGTVITSRQITLGGITQRNITLRGLHD